MRTIRTALLMIALMGPAAVGAAVPQPTFLGNWTVASSAKAPGTEPDAMQDQAEIARLSGAHLRFSAGAIEGPRPIACRGPRYELKDYQLDMLFQGTLGDPVPQARALGFTGSTVRTLETGCEMEFHFVDDTTAMFELNNRIYTMRREQH